MPAAPHARGFGSIIGSAVNVATTGLMQSVERVRTDVGSQPRHTDGVTVRGTSSVQALLVETVPGDASFKIILPGPPTLPFKCSFSLEIPASVPSGVLATPLLSGVPYPGLSGGSGTATGTNAAVRTFYGGDTVTCAVALTGSPDDSHEITLDFSAISIPGAI